MSRYDLKKLLEEAVFNFSRSGGKGGQNVNKVETKVELVFNVLSSSILAERDREKLLKRFSSRLDKQGRLHIVSQTERTQSGNRKRVIQRFEAALENALKPVKKRKKMVKSEEVKQRILEEKRMHAEKKRQRRKVELE